MSISGFARIDGSFWTADLAPELSEFGAIVRPVGEPGSNDPTGRAHGYFSLRLDNLDLACFIQVLRTQSVRLIRCELIPTLEANFWDHIPDDCVGATIWPDGYTSLADFKSPRRFVPFDEPLIIGKRPAADVEHGPASLPHVLSSGGIPILSERLLGTLLDLGAEGKTADVIFRGPIKGRPDTIQPGYKRFLPSREFDLGDRQPIDLLPAGSAENFGICAIRRSNDEELIIALDRSATEKLRQRRKTVMLNPMFQRTGSVGVFIQTFDDGIREFKVTHFN